MIHRRSLGLGLVATIGLGAFTRPAHAAYPDRVITIVVPFAAGGATDLAGRLLAEKLGPMLGEGGRAVVDNRPGAGSALGADTVRRARPDGYTLLVGSASTLAVAPASGAAARNTIRPGLHAACAVRDQHDGTAGVARQRHHDGAGPARPAAREPRQVRLR